MGVGKVACGGVFEAFARGPKIKEVETRDIGWGGAEAIRLGSRTPPGWTAP